MVGVGVIVGVMVKVRVCVAVRVLGRTGVLVGVGGGGVSVATGVLVGTHPPVVQASQQLGKPLLQLWPPLGALHFAALDLILHLVLPLAL
jgi:hypothetical protein